MELWAIGQFLESTGMGPVKLLVSNLGFARTKPGDFSTNRYWAMRGTLRVAPLSCQQLF